MFKKYFVQSLILHICILLIIIFIRQRALINIATPQFQFVNCEKVEYLDTFSHKPNQNQPGIPQLKISHKRNSVQKAQFIYYDINAQPIYPKKLAGNDISCVIFLALKINVKGKIIECKFHGFKNLCRRVINNCIIEMFANSAMNAVKTWQFYGVSKDVQHIIIPIRFLGNND